MRNGAESDPLGLLLEQLAERVAAKLAPEPAASDDGLIDWRLWTLDETAKRLTRSTRWVRERAKRGELDSIRLDGGALAFDPDDVYAFAQERRLGAATTPQGSRPRRSPKTRSERHLRAVSGDWWKG